MGFILNEIWPENTHYEFLQILLFFLLLVVQMIESMSFLIEL